MEQIDNPCYSPHLKKVLKSYQTAAMTSLSGPNTFMAAWGNGLNCSPKSNALHTASVITSSSVVDLDMKKPTAAVKLMTTTAVTSSPSSAIRSTAVTNCGESGASVINSNNTTTTINNNNNSSSSSNNCSSAEHNGSNNSNSNAKNVSISSTSSANHVSSSASNTSGGGSSGSSSSSSHEIKVKKKDKEHYAKYVEYDPLTAPPPFPIQQVPILTAPDQSRSERSETCLEGEIISCFVVGGEKRLCLPQILNSVLRDFSLQQINAVCDELQIFCSRCNPEQLEVLKVTGILPFSAPSCGLITKTDAERLCNALLHCHPPRALHDLPPDKRPFHFKVYHECFGKCKGVYTPDHYTSAHARCIECTECRGLFSPQKFVGHAHKALENRTCHWGYDSANWRGYILLAEDQDDTEQLQGHLDELKKRFQSGGKRHGVAVHNAAALPPVKTSKRKVSDCEEKELLKKLKYEETYYPYVFDPMLAYLYGGVPALSRVSAFRPWSPMVTKDGKLNLPVPPTSFVRESIPHPLPPYLSHGPPVLLNPERVVPISETERFERHYQPNVALAPPSAQIQALQKAHNSSSSTAPASAIASRAATSSTATAPRPSSPSCNLPDGNPEIELSTDTDETLSDSTTCSRTESPTHSPSKSLPIVAESVPIVKIKEEPEEEMDVNHELEAMRRLMDDEDVDKGLQERVMEKMSTLCCHLVLKLEKCSETKKQLLQELDAVRMSKRERLREASRTKRQLRKELERLLEEQAHRQRELDELRSEAEYLRRSHVDEAETALDLQQNAQMRSKINGMGQELCKLQEELLQLRKRSGFSATAAGSTATATSTASDDEQRKTERLLDVISHVRSGLAEKKEAESNAAVGD